MSEKIPKINSLDSLEGVEGKKLESELRFMPKYEIKGERSKLKEDRVITATPSSMEVLKSLPLSRYHEFYFRDIHRRLELVTGIKDMVLGIEAIDFVLSHKIPDEWKGQKIIFWSVFRSNEGYPILKYIYYNEENEVWLVDNLELNGGGGFAREPNMPLRKDSTNDIQGVSGHNDWRYLGVNRKDAANIYTGSDRADEVLRNLDNLVDEKELVKAGNILFDEHLIGAAFFAYEKARHKEGIMKIIHFKISNENIYELSAIEDFFGELDLKLDRQDLIDIGNSFQKIAESLGSFEGRHQIEAADSAFNKAKEIE
jgi:hypothetical protein